MAEFKSTQFNFDELGLKFEFFLGGQRCFPENFLRGGKNHSTLVKTYTKGAKTIDLMAISLLGYSATFSLNETQTYLGLMLLNFFTALSDKLFVPGKPFQPSLMFAGKARSYPSEALFRCSTLG